MAALFDPVADAYHRFRPRYPAAILDDLDRLTGGAGAGPTVDVGCGTGILARQLASRGAAVLGVDPSAPMLGQAHRSAGGPAYVRGAAEALPVRRGSAGWAATTTS